MVHTTGPHDENYPNKNVNSAKIILIDFWMLNQPFFWEFNHLGCDIIFKNPRMLPFAGVGGKTFQDPLGTGWGCEQEIFVILNCQSPVGGMVSGDDVHFDLFYPKGCKYWVAAIHFLSLKYQKKSALGCGYRPTSGHLIRHLQPPSLPLAPHAIQATLLFISVTFFKWAYLC